MKTKIGPVVSFFFIIGLFATSVRAQDAAILYKGYCAVCHESGGGSQAPTQAVFKQMSPEQILAALEKGTMSSQGSELSRTGRRAIAEFLSGKPFGSEPQSLIPKTAYCSRAANALPRTLAGPAWNGWGVTVANTRFQPSADAGITADDVPRLKLKWAFGFPGATSASAQPVIWQGRVYVGSWEGEFFSLDAKTGCIHWMMETDAGIRSAASIGKTRGGGFAVYFGDLNANVYAVDAATGKQLWKVRADDYPVARITGSPTLHDGRLYVPVSSREESRVANPKYECCKFRGSVVALDANTGKHVWKAYTIPEEARPMQKNRAGTQIWGPAGGAIWDAPTLDLKRNAVYVGTGNNFAPPATSGTDSLIALDMKSGKVQWSRQITPGDIWNGSCRGKDSEPATCPDEDAPDFDIGSSPILVELKDGRSLLIVGQKSGVVYALDPEQKGKTIWEQRVGKGGTLGGILWGSASDGETFFAAISDATRMAGGRGFDPNIGGGMVALALRDGKQLWKTPHPGCGNRNPCSPAQTAAVTVIPGVAFSGSIDGHLRAYSAQDGKIIWDYDSVREYTTVNGVKAKGGSIDNGGAALANGVLIVNSGYSHHAGVIPGNVLLAFSAE